MSYGVHHTPYTTYVAGAMTHSSTASRFGRRTVTVAQPTAAEQQQIAEKRQKRKSKTGFWGALFGSIGSAIYGGTIGFVKGMFCDENGFSIKRTLMTVGIAALSIAAIALTGGYAAVPLAVLGAAMCGKGMVESGAQWCSAMYNGMSTGDYSGATEAAEHFGANTTGFALSIAGVKAGLKTWSGTVKTAGLKGYSFKDPSSLRLFSIKNNVLVEGAKQSLSGLKDGAKIGYGNFRNYWSGAARSSGLGKYFNAKRAAANADDGMDTTRLASLDDAAEQRGVRLAKTKAEAKTAKTTKGKASNAAKTKAAAEKTAKKANTDANSRLKAAEKARQKAFDKVKTKDGTRVRKNAKAAEVKAYQKAQKEASNARRQAKAAKTKLDKAKAEAKTAQAKAKAEAKSAKLKADEQKAAQKAFDKAKADLEAEQIRIADRYKPQFDKLPDEFVAENAELVGNLKQAYAQRDSARAAVEAIQQRMRAGANTAENQAALESAISRLRNASKSIVDNEVAMTDKFWAFEQANPVTSGRSASIFEAEMAGLSEAEVVAAEAGKLKFGDGASLMGFRSGGPINPFSGGATTASTGGRMAAVRNGVQSSLSGNRGATLGAVPGMSHLSRFVVSGIDGQAQGPQYAQHPQGPYAPTQVNPYAADPNYSDIGTLFDPHNSGGGAPNHGAFGEFSSISGTDNYDYATVGGMYASS